MKIVRATLRLCTVLLALTYLGCSAENSDDTGTGGSTAASGGSSSTSTSTKATGGKTSATGGSSSTSAPTGGATSASTTSNTGGGTNVGGASNGGAGTSVGGTSAVTSNTSTSTGGAAATTGGATGAVGGSTAAAGGGTGTTGGTTAITTSTTPQSFGISGTVSGLSGSGLVLAIGSDTLTVTAAGAFAFPSKYVSGSAIAVTVKTQPSTPTQTCTVSAAGTIASLTADVTNVAVTCATNTYAVGGTVTGLAQGGTGVVLQDNAGDDLTVAQDGTFAFATKVASNATYTVTIKTQPSSPTQTCTVSGGSGTVGAADVTSVTVNCSTNTFTIGGMLTGLDGTGLVLQDNNGDDLALSTTGSFAFATPVQSGKPFAVTVKTQPTGKSQTCVVTNGTGTVAAGNVTTVGVNCTTNTYAVGGSITGLTGTGLTLQNELDDNLVVTSGTSFVFPTKVASGGVYSVTVLNQPTSPTQVCTVTTGTDSGAVTSADITSVAITCSTSSFTVGGTVVGVQGTALVLQDNNGDDLPVAADGTFTFATSVLSGAKYAVTIKTQPGPTEICSISGGAGTMGGSNVTSVTVNCSTEAHTVSGTVQGLVATGLQLSLNDGTPLAISGNGSFAFPTLIAKGGAYAVTVAQSPSSPSETCLLSNASGTVASADITNVSVICYVNSFTIGGQVSGLAGTGLQLQDNTDTAHVLAISADGAFAFSQQVLSGQGYAVTVVGQPTSPLQVCSVDNGTGLVTNAAISNVAVTCVTSRFKVGGTISGLSGTVVLSDNTTDTKTLTSNGSFTFDQTVASGSSYSVQVQTQPDVPSQTCTVTGGSGSVVNADISSVSITCVTNQFKVGGSVTGLKSGESLSLQNNGIDTITMGSDGTFTFATSITSGNPYAVTISSPPLTQNCVVNGGTGNVGDADVTSVSINCTNKPTVGGSVTGLSNSGTVGLALNGSTETLSITSNGTFAFTTPFNQNDTYAVTVTTQPTSPWQTCSVTNGSGTIGTASVTNVAVNCTTNTYALAVNVTGLSGTGLVLQNNNADSLTITQSGVTPFATPVASGGSYAVTVLTQPSSQLCTVTSANGTVANADITLNVTCVNNTYTIGGTVIGPVGSGLTLLDNGGDALSISASGAFIFATQLASNTAYAVTVGTQPTGVTCTVTNGAGTVVNANVTNVTVVCPTQYNFDTSTQGVSFYKPPTGSTATWSGTEGDPTAGAVVASLPFGTGSCPSGTNIQLVGNLNLTGYTTFTAWVKIVGQWPTGDRSGGAQLFINGSSGYKTNSAVYWWSWTLGQWKQLTFTLPSVDLSAITSWGVAIYEGTPAVCQDTTVEVDSISFQ